MGAMAKFCKKSFATREAKPQRLQKLAIVLEEPNQVFQNTYVLKLKKVLHQL